jgi:hypothetical protein
MAFTRVTVLSLAVAAACGTLRAQQAPSLLTPGQRVRVTVPAAGLSYEYATIVAARPDTIVIGRVQLRPESGSWRVDTIRTVVPLREIRSLEVFRGARPVPWRWAPIGGVLGAGLGAAIGSSTPDAAPNCWGCITIPGWYVGAFLGGTVGGVGGWVLGSLGPAERWEAIPLEPSEGVKVGVLVTRAGGLGLGAAVSF